MTEYRLDIYDTAGVLQYILTDFTNLSFVKRVNSPGVVQFSVAGNHSLLSNLADKWQTEIWRKPEDGTWTREITGLYRMLTWVYGDIPKASIFCNGLMSMLDWRIVAWYAGYADRSKFTSAKAETIANTLVSYNACANATVANGRKREGHIDGLTVEADGAAGNTLDWFCAYDNLLETLQSIAKVGGGDFDVVKTSSTAWQWRWYEGQLGTDRSASVVFALERGNMSNPVYMDNRTQERTAAIVGGLGEGADRAITTRTGTNYHVDNNNIEVFVNATDIDTTAGLETRGDESLAETEAVKTFNFDILQTPACEYGTHYFLGDKVKAVNPYNGTAYTVKIQSVSISLQEDGGESISVEMSEPL